MEIELTAMTHGGEALGRHKGRVMFVPHAIPGETVKARVVEDKGRFARAALIEILKASPARIVPRWQHFGVCGGCQWQHMDYPKQLELKQRIVIDQLALVGGLHDVTVHPVIGSPNPWAYRSHTTFHVADDGRTVIPIEECHIVREEVLEHGRTRTSAFLTELFKRLRVQVGTDGEEWLTAANAVDEQTENDQAGPLTGEGVVHYAVRGRTFQVRAGSFFPGQPGADGKAG